MNEDLLDEEAMRDMLTSAQVKNELYAYKSDGANNATIATFSGRMLDVLNPDPDNILIEDIAHALSLTCRWGGQCEFFYSVAQHSILCADLAHPGYEFEALMHDASEAYLQDIARPVKLKLSNYKEIEDKLMTAIANKFGFQWPLRKVVKEVDEIALGIEWKCLMAGIKTNLVERMTCEEAEEKFLKYFKQYYYA